MKRQKPSFDQQAHQFDMRTGLTQARCEQILLTIEQLIDIKGKEQLVEIGCGTGEIGVLLANKFKQYTGIDFSIAMLKQFKRRSGEQRISLLQADCNTILPICDQGADLLFSSRAIHWINEDHLIKETYRIVKKTPTSMLIVGRVQHSPDSWEFELRKHCHQLLRKNKLTPLDGEAHLNKLCDKFLQKQAKIVQPVVASQWQQKRSLEKSLADWASKPGLAGTNPSENIKRDILMQLKDWAYEKFNQKLPVDTERRYVLYPIKLF